MAATVLPPVRGHRRLGVLGALVLSGAASAAAVGALGGLVLSALGPAPVGLVAVGCAASAVGDVALARRGRPVPWAVGRQVPLEWGRIFSPATAAILYGARLGVGPATVLSTWTWWAMFVVAGLDGVGTAAVAGVAFHLARVATMIVAEGGQAADVGRAARLDRLDRPAAAAAVLVAVGLGLGALA